MTTASENRTTFSEDRVPTEGIEQTIGELVDLYGGEMTSSGERERRFTLPLRRGMSVGGAIECRITWSPDDEATSTVNLSCDRDVDAPRFQRILLLIAGTLGAITFMLWPFFPAQKQWGTLAWLGGAVAIAVYLMTLRRTSGGIAWDFLQRLARSQRGE
jgi:hypothetical protein